MKFFVYALINPVSHEVFYVGCTKNLINRKSGHTLCSCSKVLCPTKKDKYIIEMGCDPIFIIVDTVESWGNYYLEKETEWIERFIGLGYVLTNQRWQKREVKVNGG